MHAIVLAYFAKSNTGASPPDVLRVSLSDPSTSLPAQEPLLIAPYTGASKVYLRLLGMPVGEHCAVTTEVTFKVSHFKNMLRNSTAKLKREMEKPESLSESFKHFMHYDEVSPSA